MKSRDVHYWRRRLLAAFLRQRQLLAPKPVNRCRNPSGLDTAVPIMVRGTSPEIGRIPICPFPPPPIAVRFLTCAFLRGRAYAADVRRLDPSGHRARIRYFQEHRWREHALECWRHSRNALAQAAEWAFMLYGSARITA